MSAAQRTDARRKFRSARGRPPQPSALRDQADYGTPELILKRALGTTQEPIDLCLQRQIITPSQHRAALHLRWLYTVRYGAPGISALDIARGQGRELSCEDNSQWRKQRESDYKQAIHLLQQHYPHAPVISCVIHNEMPAFLQLERVKLSLSQQATHQQILRQASDFAEALQLLGEYWRANAQFRS